MFGQIEVRWMVSFVSVRNWCNPVSPEAGAGQWWGGRGLPHPDTRRGGRLRRVRAALVTVSVRYIVHIPCNS